ncbi:T9SS type A sorting domain-containing protein [Rufibacter latericius]|uniref:T9SS C-terminal target domain-containing protein n=1 Tax=Rufibacter latericius TaxID=2487040 RepID=A0A3M9MLR0_9BACT|nr:T9SS type A sorting domain-containing protein [Rufibacter latericius]RNI26466.1 T9SS C-terminal target domain-containing protein [Rufibacter latericius]
MKHLYKIVFIFLLVVSSLETYAQSWTWVVNAKGNHQMSDADRKIVTDHAGNVYIAGYYTGSFKLGEFTLVNSSSYNSKIYLAKLDPEGNAQWLHDLETGDSYAHGIAITLDEAGNFYLTGTIGGSIFVSKYDTLGNLTWSNNFNNEFYGYGKSIALDQAENIYVIGETGWSPKFNNGVFLSKLTLEGETVWLKVFESTCHSNGASGGDIAVDALGNSYITGLFACDNLSFDGIKVANGGGWQDKTFLAKINTDGQAQWAQQIPNLVNIIPQVSLTETNEVVVAGMASFCCSQATPQLFKFSALGNLLWIKEGKTYQGIPQDIATDYEGNIYLGGTSFGNYGGTEMDFHLEKYGPDGELHWNREVKLSVSEYLMGISLDNKGNLYAIGSSMVEGLGVIGNSYSQPSTTFVAKLNTGSTTTQRPYKPVVPSLYPVCDGQKIPELKAIGEQITWYDSPALQVPISKGNTFSPVLSKTDTFYVTQTIDQMRSWAKPVIVQFSTLKSFSINESNDTLYAPASVDYTYKWFHNNILLEDSTRSYIVTDTTGIFKVVISDTYCSKETQITKKDLIEEDQLIAYPNPSPDKITLQVKVNKPSNFTLNVYSSNGPLIFNYTLKDKKELKKEIDISHLPRGLYLCELIYGSERKNVRVLKE